MKKPDAAAEAKPKTVRGKYIPHLLEQGSNVAVLDPDILQYFPDSASVNEALRAFLVMRNQFALLYGLPGTPVARVSPQKHSLAFDPRVGRFGKAASPSKDKFRKEG